MYVEKMKLVNFRNYNELDINFNTNKNIIYGYNAQGKTNILEALYFVSSAKSHRTNKEKEMINWKSEESYITLLVKKSLDIKIDVKLNKNDKKIVRINNSPISKIGELFGNLNCVMFSPEDLQLIKEGPSIRRRFLDIGISQIKPSYFYNLQQYYKSILQRNSLLREIKKNRKNIEMIDIWNNNIIEIGAKIVYYRNNYLNKIAKHANDIHNKISNENLDIKYIPSVKIDDLSNLDSIKAVLNNSLEKNIENDINTGLTSIGPHRDNFEVLINGINSRIYGSQGQQRTAVLSLKLSEIDLYKDELGEYPILLLDDVMSELDERRQNFLLSFLENIQVFITCTSKEKYLGQNASFFKVENGKVILE